MKRWGLEFLWLKKFLWNEGGKVVDETCPPWNLWTDAADEGWKLDCLLNSPKGSLLRTEKPLDGDAFREKEARPPPTCTGRLRNWLALEPPKLRPPARFRKLLTVGRMKLLPMPPPWRLTRASASSGGVSLEVKSSGFSPATPSASTAA